MNANRSPPRPPAASQPLPVPPRLVLAGLATLQRQELCDSLAILEQLSSVRLATDSIGNVLGKLSRQSPHPEPAFKRRVQQAAEAHRRSECPDAHLRLLLWVALLDAIGLPRLVPLSTATADRRSAEVASRTAQELSQRVRNELEPSNLARWRKAAAKVRSIFSDDQDADFGDVVRFEVARAIGEQADALQPAVREQIVDTLRSSIARLPDELRDEGLEQAVRTGDLRTVTAIATGTAWGGLAVGVALADFSAYILAAQASAFIPLLGGKTAVSALAVVANPLLLVPALVGGAWWANQRMNRNLRRGQASRLSCFLAMRGISCESADAELKRCLDDFKRIGSDGYAPAAAEVADSRVADAKNRQRSVRDHLRKSLALEPSLTPYLNASELSPTPGAGVDELLTTAKLDEQHKPERHIDAASEAAIVGGLTFAELIHDVALIDPRVAAAADFSRSESLTDIFEFGGFAERVRSLSESARIGAENNLLGYVAEVFVAVRLSGHDVELPAAPNNPGYDLLVDGQPFQVKCYADDGAAIGALESHFSRYPDTPVFINSEVQPALEASGASWVDRVYFVDGYDHESVSTL